MPSPQYIFRDIFTTAQLRAMLQELATTGRITSTSGSGRSESFAVMDAQTLAFELRAELNRLQGIGGPSKVEQRLF